MNKKQNKKDVKPIFPSVGVNSGQVITVLGPMPVESLGVTLGHEHIIADFSIGRPLREEGSRRWFYDQPVSMEILGELRLAPYENRDNQLLGDIDVAADEVAKFRDWGGGTIVEVTNVGAFRDPLALKQISLRTGVNIIMGSGYYLNFAHPPRMKLLSVDDIADEIVCDVTEGVPETGVRSGIIGEIGIEEFDEQEEKSLRGAARAASRTQVAMTVHTAKTKHGPKVLDIVEEEGADPNHVLMCDMQLHLDDLDYQMALADRGAFLGHDHVTCNFDWSARGHGMCPCDEERAVGIKQLIDSGYLNCILLSHDVHCKIMWTTYGGFGYAYILRRFSQRLRANGVTDDQIHTLLVDNPRRLFSAKYRWDGAVR
jgi:phosphotriesterase-related protein